MSAIGWSKAPEGATHHCSARNAWFKNDEHDMWLIWQAYGRMHEKPLIGWCFCHAPDSEFLSIKEWTGEGLPPVGAVCEINLRSSADKDAVDIGRYGDHVGQKVEIVAHHDIGGGCRAAVYAVQNDFVFEYHSLVEGNFRPVRTPEQIAADEREHSVRNACTAISKALAELHESEEPTAVAIIKAMIDAGYSKQVMP